MSFLRCGSSLLRASIFIRHFDELNVSQNFFCFDELSIKRQCLLVVNEIIELSPSYPLRLFLSYDLLLRLLKIQYNKKNKIKMYSILLTIKNEKIRLNSKTSPLKLNIDFQSKPMNPLKNTKPITKNNSNPTHKYNRSLFLSILFRLYFLYFLLIIFTFLGISFY